MPQDRCACTEKVTITPQQRYSAKLKAARAARKADWEKRKFAYQSLAFDGRVNFTPATGVPPLGAIDLRKYL